MSETTINPDIPSVGALHVFTTEDRRGKRHKGPLEKLLLPSFCLNKFTANISIKASICPSDKKNNFVKIVKIRSYFYLFIWRNLYNILIYYIYVTDIIEFISQKVI